MYDALLYQRDGKRLRTVVFYTGGVRRAPDRVDAGSLRFQVQNVYLGNIDGDVRLAQLKEREATSALTDDDVLEVAFLLLMGHRKGIAYEVAEEAVRLAAALPGAAMAQCRSAVIGLAERYLTEEEFEALLEGDAVARRIVSEMVAEGEARGKAEGHSEAKAEAVLVVLRERFGEFPQRLADHIRSQRELATLDRWMVLALRTTSLAEFERETAG